MNTLRFFVDNRSEMLLLTGQHLLLAAVSTLLAALAGIPMGIAVARRPGWKRWVLGFANVVQTIPSLALFGFLIPLPFLGGIGARTALVALVLYALLPIVRNTYAGISGVDPAVREAALAMGLTRGQMLWSVELPLALPVIFTGLRVATVISVGVATIAAAIGAGGLGMYIFRGVSMVDNRLILAGAIPAALLALAADLTLGVLESRLTPARLSRVKARTLALAAGLVLLLLLGSLAVWALGGLRHQRVVVGSKNFSEQIILAEVLAQQIERRAGLEVERRLNLGGTLICHQALVAGQIDLYPEYTGTAWTAILKEAPPSDAGEVAAQVKKEYARRFHVEVGDSLGFENTFAILVRKQDAQRLGLKTISDAAPYTPQWHAGFGYEFMERADGFPGLSRTYGLRFASPPRVMDLTLSYRALANGQVDMIAGNSTDGLITALNLLMLEDNRHYFPPYQAVPLVRQDTLERHPQIRAALAELSGALSAEAMRRMNGAVDLEHRDPKQVAAEFLKSR